jgi:hypothetical protein
LFIVNEKRLQELKRDWGRNFIISITFSIKLVPGSGGDCVSARGPSPASPGRGLCSIIRRIEIYLTIDKKNNLKNVITKRV